MIRYCALGSACVGWHKPSQRAAQSDRTLCADCRDVVARDIALLPVDYLDLAQHAARRPGLSDSKIARPQPGSKEPIDLFIDELSRAIHWALTVWEIPVREAAGLSTERHRNVRPGWAVQTASALLVKHLDTFAGLPATWGYSDGLDAGVVERTGMEGIGQLRLLHLRARAVLGLTKLTVRLPGECSKCNAWALRRTEGSDTVYCAACDQRWTYADYQRYVGLSIAHTAVTGGGDAR